jgi:hypothetical protein
MTASVCTFFHLSRLRTTVAERVKAALIGQHVHFPEDGGDKDVRAAKGPPEWAGLGGAAGLTCRKRPAAAGSGRTWAPRAAVVSWVAILRL